MHESPESQYSCEPHCNGPGNGRYKMRPCRYRSIKLVAEHEVDKKRQRKIVEKEEQLLRAVDTERAHSQFKRQSEDSNCPVLFLQNLQNHKQLIAPECNIVSLSASFTVANTSALAMGHSTIEGHTRQMLVAIEAQSLSVLQVDLRQERTTRSVQRTRPNQSRWPNAPV